jgi:hypothetical protein
MFPAELEQDAFRASNANSGGLAHRFRSSLTSSVLVEWGFLAGVVVGTRRFYEIWAGVIPATA